MNSAIQPLKRFSRSRAILPEEKQAVLLLLHKAKEISNFLKTPEVCDAIRFQKSVIGNKSYEELSDPEKQGLSLHLSALTGRDKAQEDFNELKLTAQALCYHLSGLSELEVVQKLKSKPWRFKHEVFVRYIWMKSQKNEILRGTSFNHPFLCQVGSVEGRRNIDREFYVLLKFIPLFYDRTKTRLTFKSKTPPFFNPDFIATTGRRKAIGIEITESNIGEGSHEKDKLLEKLQDALHPKFHHKKLSIVLRETPNIVSLGANFDQAIQWILSEEKAAKKALKIRDEYNARHDQFNFSLRFSRSEHGYLFLTAGEVQYGNRPELELAESLRNCITKKLSGQASSLRPCYLVIITRDGLPIQNDSLVIKASTLNLGKSYTTHFDQIWALHGRSLLRLV